MAKVGGIEYSPEFGGLELINKPATSVPQDLATAMGQINEGLLGATYTPLWIIGRQITNGINYHLVCKEVRATKDTDTMIVVVVINIPPVKSDGTKPEAKIVKIIEDARLEGDIARVFKAATTLVGVSYTPLAYIGKQIVNGTNYFFIAQAKVIYPGSEPYAVAITIHDSLDKNATILSVAPITDDLVGYAFTWLK